jgi:integrase
VLYFRKEGIPMRGSIHHDKHGYKVHFQGRWFRRVKLNGQWVSFKERRDLAEDFLVLVNGDYLRGKYDVRDWTSDEPLAFDVMAQHWLELRQKEVRSFRQLKNDMGKAISFFGNRNIRTIQYAELEDFLYSLQETLAPKTKKNIFTTLHSLWQWLTDREFDRPNPITMPKFPKLAEYKPAIRKIVSPESQARVLTRLKEIGPPKAYIGVLWCITYCLRFEEVRQLKLKDFENGYMTVWDWKQKNYKQKKMLPEDWAIVEEEKKKVFGNDFFFRHGVGSKRQFGKDYLSERIRKAAKDLGFEGVVPYAIVKHSTITALSDHYTPEEIKKYYSLHLSPALYRYLHLKEEKKQEMYARARAKIVDVPLTVSPETLDG